MSVSGLSQFRTRWQALPRKVRDAVKAELEAVAEDLVQRMRRAAPRESGRLADSIGWTWGDAPAGSMTVGTVGGREHAAMRITVYAGGKNAFYAVFQEFGTVNAPANPFFFPVWRARRSRAKARITRAINEAIRAL